MDATIPNMVYMRDASIFWKNMKNHVVLSHALTRCDFLAHPTMWILLQALSRVVLKHHRNHRHGQYCHHIDDETIVS